tara:strand:- start:489 stop:731 length:243 start_codon:yes stop_codon:yes gene_type:complete
MKEMVDKKDEDLRQGILPISALQFNVIDWFEGLSNEFLDELRDAVKYHGLEAGIRYAISDESISDIADINGLVSNNSRML